MRTLAGGLAVIAVAVVVVGVAVFLGGARVSPGVSATAGLATSTSDGISAAAGSRPPDARASSSPPGSAASPGTSGSAASPSTSASPAPRGSSAFPAASASPAPAGSSAAASAVTLVGAGDIGVCGSSHDEDTAALVESMPGSIFTLGDNAYDQGTEPQFRDCFGSSWGRFKDRIALPVPGNHEYETADAAGYLAYFGSAAAPDGQTWYSRDLGGWHVVVLDATCDRAPGGCAAGSPQVAWLRADLAASGARCTLALWHQPRFSSGFHGNDAAVAAFWDALSAAGADLVLNGHDHDYERFAPQAPDGIADPGRGITEMVVGTGGAALRPFEGTRANSVARSASAYGVISLTLTADGWSSRFASTDGSFSDVASGACH